jgi:tetratricopeptide (TPR) repeat protein
MDEETRQLIALGREHYQAREYDKALSYLEEVVKTQRGAADVWDMLGVMYALTNRLELARKSFEEAIKINPAYTDAALNLAVTLNDLGRYEEARAVYRSTMSRAKTDPSMPDRFVRGKIANMHASVGAAYAGTGMYHESIAEYRKALDLCPTFNDLRTKLAAVLRDSGDLVAAERELVVVKDGSPRYVPARLALGLTLFMQGKRADAEKEWAEVLAIEPENKQAKFYLQNSK